MTDDIEVIQMLIVYSYTASFHLTGQRLGFYDFVLYYCRDSGDFHILRDDMKNHSSNLRNTPEVLHIYANL